MVHLGNNICFFIDECIESTRDIVRKRDLYPQKREITLHSELSGPFRLPKSGAQLEGSSGLTAHRGPACDDFLVKSI